MKGILPASWAMATIEKLFMVVGGGTPSTANSKFWRGETPWITSADISKDHQITVRKTVSKLGIEQSATNLVPAGSIVLATRVGLGKVAVAQSDLCFSQDCQGLMLPECGQSNHYFVYQLGTLAVDIIRSGRGTTISGVTKRTLLQLQLKIAPAGEQHRIVDAIESYLTRLDDAVATVERVQRNLKRYRASVLKTAVEGRLVATEAELARKEGRDYEAAGVLLERILEERRRRWIEEAAEKGRAKAEEKARKTGNPWTAEDNAEALGKERAKAAKKYKEPAAPGTDGLPVLPEGWCWANLDQVTVVITSGSRGWAKYYADDGPIFVRAQDIKTDRLILNSVAHVRPPDSAEGSRTLVDEGDVLVTITGANVTKTAYVPNDLGEAYVSQHVGLCKPGDRRVTPYLYVWLVCPSGGRARLQEDAYGAGKPGLNLTNLRELAVPMPPAAEQIRLVAEVDRLFSIATGISSVADQDVMRLRRLRQSILKWAFEGKLVDQDANDEPASVLLEHIKAQRAKLGDGGKKTSKRGRKRRAG